MTPTRAPRNPSRSAEGGRKGSAKLRTVCVSLLLLAPAFAACSAGDVPQDEASAESHQDLAACTVTTTAAGYVGKPDYWGTITIKNTSGGAMTTPAISFKVPSGVTCDYHESGWTHTQAGSTCTYSRTSKSAIAAGASLTLHFSTDGASSFTPTGIKVSANGCSGSGAGGSASNVSDAAQRQQAAWLAESLLARRASVYSDGWNEEGESAGLSWRVHSSPHDSGRNTPLAVPLHRIKVTVAWTAGTRPGQFELITLRPQAPQPPGSVTR